MAIKYLSREKIDVAKWDKCISKSFNGIIYAFSWYLDIVSPNWEALINNDYEQVMPLTHSEKFNIPYIFQPYFTQQLGIFSVTKLNAMMVETFLTKIPEKYRYIEMNLNGFNQLITQKRIWRTNTNYKLDLIRPYEHTQSQYSQNTKRNIKKAEKNNITIKRGLSSADFVKFKHAFLSGKENLKENHFHILRKLTTFASLYKFGEGYGAYNKENQLCAAAFFIMSHNKAIFIAAASNNQGKETSAMFLLVDYFIKTFSERNLTLDFEGSNIDGVARFYSGFGAQATKYYSIKINRLPWYIKLLKIK